ncbi:RHS repeat domain-containing protein [Asticcacaulis sp. 201]|nr:RHS repeat domain-containing protein [Asticcacaulis sp. 201]MDV6331319.1 RHS repeat domain-containing protein [Asticcacaulis sp. 201]
MRKIFIITAAMASLCAGHAYAGDTIYKYDAQGRVVEVDYPNGAKVTYTYDAAGNRTQVVKTT